MMGRCELDSCSSGSPEADCPEHGNELSDSIKAGNFLSS